MARAAEVNVGDEVTVVLGLADEPTKRGTIASDRRFDGKVLVRFRHGGTMWFPVEMIDAGRVTLGPGRHRVADPDTARLAAEAAGERLTEHQWAVLNALVEAGPAGLIDHDHEARSGLIPTSAGKRRKELERLGLVERVPGGRRPTAQQRLAQVHRVTARGVAVFQHHQRGAA